MILKKTLVLLLLPALFLLFVIAGCNTGEMATPDNLFAEDITQDDAFFEKQEVKLLVFAAASLAEVIEEVNRAYMKKYPHVTIFINLDSSGTLKTQIENGAECDLFISSAQKAMNELDINADPTVNVKQSDFVLKETRKDILENRVVLAVPAGNPKSIVSFDELAVRLTEGDILMAMGNIDVPVGQYTSNILLFYSLAEEALAASGVISYASTVKEVTTQVAESLVDCGVVYSTDARAANLEVVDQATAEMTGGLVIYPAAVMKNSRVIDEAKAYLDFLTGPDGAALLEAFGFTPIR